MRDGFLGTGDCGKVFKIMKVGEGTTTRGAQGTKMYAAKRIYLQSMHTFENEIEVLKKIDHPGMVQLIDVQKMGKGYNYIIMELVEGKTLAQYLREIYKSSHEMPRALFITWALQMASIVNHLHTESKIIHGDLHQGNWIS